MSSPQTVGFEMEVSFRNIERSADLSETETFVFHEFEKMITRYRLERRRLKRANQATSARYRMFLTDHGKSRVQADVACADRHKGIEDWKQLN